MKSPAPSMFGPAAKPQRLVAFAVTWRHRFRLNGRKFQLKTSGVETIELVQKICWARDQFPTGWGQRTVKLVRRIVELERSDVLSYLLTKTNDPFALAILVWLRGLLGGRLGTTIVASYRTHEYRLLRMQVVKTLKKMSAWSILDQIAQSELDPQIRRLAMPVPGCSFQDRLRRFRSNVAIVNEGDMNSARSIELVATVAIPVTRTFAPKSNKQIRKLLSRIHRLVGNRPTDLPVYPPVDSK